MYSLYLKQIQVLCVIWRYILWAACPQLSWFAVAFSRSISTVRALACKFRIRSFNLNIRYRDPIRYMVGRTGHTYTYIHATCNAVSLVWGSLRLAPTKLRLVIRLLTIEGEDAWVRCSGVKLMDSLSSSSLELSLDNKHCSFERVLLLQDRKHALSFGDCEEHG